MRNTLEFLDGQASMAVEISRARDAAWQARMDAARWRRRHTSVSKALCLVVCVETSLLLAAAIWLLGA